MFRTKKSEFPTAATFVVNAYPEAGVRSVTRRVPWGVPSLTHNSFSCPPV